MRKLFALFAGVALLAATPATAETQPTMSLSEVTQTKDIALSFCPLALQEYAKHPNENPSQIIEVAVTRLHLTKMQHLMLLAMCIAYANGINDGQHLVTTGA